MWLKRFGLYDKKDDLYFTNIFTKFTHMIYISDLIRFTKFGLYEKNKNYISVKKIKTTTSTTYILRIWEIIIKLIYILLGFDRTLSFYAKKKKNLIGVLFVFQ